MREVLIRILHKFLICLGDLARYQIEYDSSSNTRLAYKYYKKSLILLPSNGTPLNQIGTLVGSENYGCDAAYYYLYCLNCTEPFSSARENLKFLFAKNKTRYEKLIANIKKMPDRSKMDDEQLALLRLKEIKRFLVLYLYLIDCILFQNQSINNHQIQELCQLCLQEFNSCMFYTKSIIPNNNKEINDETAEKVYHLSDELVFKLTLIILMAIEQLKAKKLHQTNSSNIYFICVAFAILFFSHILNRTIIRLQDSLSNVNNKNERLLSVEDMNEEDNNPKESDTIIDNRNDSKSRSSSSSSNTSSSSSSNRSSGSDKSGRAKLNKVKLLYGLRRRKHNSDSDSNEDEEDENDYTRSENDDDTVVQSQSSGSDRKSRRRNENKKMTSKKKSVAKFLDRDNLSETELNLHSDNSSSDENSSDKKSIPKYSNQNLKKPTNNLTNSIQLNKEDKNKTSETLTQTQPNNQNDIDLLQLDLVNNTNIVNFKEFSTQLFSSFSLIGQQQNQTAPQYNAATSDDFVDNEIYKFILSGNKDVGIPPGFEVNPKEAQEIEELGQKIASFQIETDTEMSIFNTDDTSSNSCDNNTSSSDDFDEQNSNIKRKKNPNNELKNAKLMVNVLQSQGLLPTIKVFCDWLLCNKKIIQSISKVSTTMWSKLAIFLNCCPLEKYIAHRGNLHSACKLYSIYF